MKSALMILIGNINSDSRVKKEIETLTSIGIKVTLAIWNWETITYKNENIRIIDIKFGNQKSQYGRLFTFLKTVAFWPYVSKIVKREKYDFIHCNDLCTLGVLFFIRKNHKERFIYDAHELFPEMYPRNSIRYHIWTWVERKTISRAYAVITTEKYRAEYLKKKYSLSTSPFIISNYPLYQKVIPRNVKKELKLDNGKILLGYAGIIMPGRGLELIIAALKSLPNDYVLVLVGYAWDKNYYLGLMEYARIQDLEQRIYCYGKVPTKELLDVIAGCNISIALYENNGLNNYYCSPNKVFDSIMAGVKVITNDYPSLKFIKEYKFIRLIAEIEPGKIASAAVELIKGNCEIQDSIKRQFSWELFEDTFKRVYY
jgi:glycosyltransferase involved in cell wall biosynthesis